MGRMNCWRTTWGATLANVGKILWGLSLGSGAGISPISLGFGKEALGWIFLVGLVLHAIGTQWTGMASADQLEVKRQLGLKADGFPMDDSLMSQQTIDDRARIGLGVKAEEEVADKPNHITK